MAGWSTEFRSLYYKAKVIDRLIDRNYNPDRQHAISLKDVGDAVAKLFPEFIPKGGGWHKVIFEVHSGSNILVFKIGRRTTIEYDHRAYNRLPTSIRRDYFARIFWHTRYCLLQEYGEETQVSEAELSQLRAIGEKFGLLDIDCSNIRRVDGRVKIIDANILEGSTSKALKILYSLKYKHPWLYEFIKRLLYIEFLVKKRL